jgi:hypothetical protein
VEDVGVRVVHHLPAGLLGPDAPVDILAVDPEGLIEQADLVDHLATNEQEGPGYGVHLVRLHRVEIGQIVLGHHLASRKQAAQTGEPEEGHRRRRNTPAAGKLQRAILVQHSAAGDADIGIGVHELHHPVDRAILDERVRVQEQDVVRPALADRLVVGPGEADVVLVLDEVNVGEALLEHLHAIVT